MVKFAPSRTETRYVGYLAAGMNRCGELGSFYKGMPDK